VLYCVCGVLGWEGYFVWCVVFVCVCVLFGGVVCGGLATVYPYRMNVYVGAVPVCVYVCVCVCVVQCQRIAVTSVVRR
jgi:hypothetical protein